MTATPASGSRRSSLPDFQKSVGRDKPFLQGQSTPDMVSRKSEKQGSANNAMKAVSEVPSEVVRTYASVAAMHDVSSSAAETNEPDNQKPILNKAKEKHDGNIAELEGGMKDHEAQRTWASLFTLPKGNEGPASRGRGRVSPHLSGTFEHLRLKSPLWWRI